MQNCKSIVTMVYELLHCIGMANVMLQMMSVLQEVKGLTNKLYFIILPVGRAVSMQNFRLNVHMVYLF